MKYQQCQRLGIVELRKWVWPVTIVYFREGKGGRMSKSIIVVSSLSLRKANATVLWEFKREEIRYMQIDSAWVFNVAVAFSFFSKHPLTFLKACLSIYIVISCGRWSAQKSSSSWTGSVRMPTYHIPYFFLFRAGNLYSGKIRTSTQ